MTTAIYRATTKMLPTQAWLAEYVDSSSGKKGTCQLVCASKKHMRHRSNTMSMHEPSSSRSHSAKGKRNSLGLPTRRAPQEQERGAQKRYV